MKSISIKIIRNIIVLSIIYVLILSCKNIMYYVNEDEEKKTSSAHVIEAIFGIILSI